MKLDDLKDGRRYRLTKDVTNPKLDRRERYDVDKLPWTKGDVFRARVWPARSPDEPAGVCLDAVLIQGTPRKATRHVNRYHEGMTELLAALELVEEKPADVCARTYVDPKEALRKLFELGKITIADVEEACAAVSEEPEP